MQQGPCTYYSKQLLISEFEKMGRITGIHKEKTNTDFPYMWWSPLLSYN